MKIRGYEIIRKEAYTKINYIVLGKKEKGLTPYVTWEYRSDTNSYFWEHYFTNEWEALKDFHIRLAEGLNRPF